MDAPNVDKRTLCQEKVFKGFPTNRYTLELLDLIHVIKENVKQEEPVLCEDHEKPCAMFCLEQDCWKLLRPKCQIQMHLEHKLVTLGECTDNLVELKQMKQEVTGEITSLSAYEKTLQEGKAMISRKGEEAEEAINKRVDQLKQIIDIKAEELRRNLRQKSNEQVTKLDAVLHRVKKQTTLGHQLRNNIQDRPKKNISKAVKRLVKIQEEFVGFIKSAQNETSKEVEYNVDQLNEKKYDFDISNIGEIFTSTYVINFSKQHNKTNHCD